MTDEKTLLWVDDDGAERFLHETYNLGKRGWTITWALTALEAARSLEEKAFDAVLIDQRLPPQKYEDEPSYWGGCALLYWLRGGERIQDAPDFDFLGELTPHDHNQKIRVTLVSAFYDDHVMDHISKAPGPAVELVQKPIILTRLLACLEGS